MKSHHKWAPPQTHQTVCNTNDHFNIPEKQNDPPDQGTVSRQQLHQQEIVPHGRPRHIDLRSNALDFMDSTSRDLGPDEIYYDAHLVSRQGELDLETWQEFSVGHEQPTSKVAPKVETEPVSKAQQKPHLRGHPARNWSRNMHQLALAPLRARVTRRLPLPRSPHHKV